MPGIMMHDREVEMARRRSTIMGSWRHGVRRVADPMYVDEESHAKRGRKKRRKG